MHLLLLAAVFGIAFGTQKSYYAYSVFRCNPNLEQHELLRNLTKDPGYDLWSEIRELGDNADIMVSPDQQDYFKYFLKENNIDCKITIGNVQKLIDEESFQLRRARSTTTGDISFDRFHRYTEINDYLKKLASRYPNLVTLQTIGKSYEGRDLTVIKISSGASENRPAILIDAGIHAREWIAPATALYVINQLVENNTVNSDLTDSVDWYVLPVLNPDGYEYTHEKERLWRKTRSSSPNSNCIGVDMNRNFDFHWNEIGASNNPCSLIYAGKVAASEPETKALKNFALNNKNNIKLYLTFHCYGNLLLYPWGYTETLPTDWKTLHALAEEANRAHKAVGGDSFRIGSSSNALYASAGGSDDYMKGVAGIDLSYTVELTNGWFETPTHLIEPTVTKFFASIRTFGNYIKKNF